MSTVDSNKEKKVETNTQQPKTPAPAPAPKAPAKPQEPQKVKSYTERFVDMENMIVRMSYAINFQAKTIEELMKQIQVMNEELDRLTLVRKSVNAIMKISETEETSTHMFSLERVAEKVEQLELQAAKEQLAKDLQDGVVKQADTVENDLTVIEFESIPEGSYGLISVGTTVPELKKELIGKKVGDVVQKVKITGIYAYVLETPKTEGTDGKTQENPQSPAAQ